MSFAVGSLVKTRGTEWVVLPGSTDALLVLRPLGGTEDEVTGVHTGLESVESAHFDLPRIDNIGDYQSCRFLRDAIRLGFRSSAGPFRSFGQIAVEPRPYQLVPLLMAMKLMTVRLLVADDVGIGKTIEACLIARELLDRGEAQRLAVLCPPHLAEQWQVELSDKFHIATELVLSSTASKLERDCPPGQSIFDVYPYVVVSTDFIKTDRRRDDFLRSCPDLVIIDEAHGCAFGASARGGRHQRFDLVRGLSKKPSRHMILVTATPHSGNEEAFRSLLTFLNPDFANLPDDLTGTDNEHHRRRLAAHFVQRRRADIRSYMQAETPFPTRLEKEESYKLSADYKKLFASALDYVRESVIDKQGNRHGQRVRWWSALALLRSLASSPAAAAATLRSRAITADTETVEEADELGRLAVMDMADDDSSERLDIAPGADAETDASSSNRRRLLAMARDADRLMGDKDEKLLKAVDLVKLLLSEGCRPILFCRFIPTADYVAEELRKRLRGVDVVSVTGTLPPADREERIKQLAEHPKRVLVCTDCLSEGINLQDRFDAVMHYDLSWNPTRHEQREGRVDRFGQKEPTVRTVVYYGIDNQIDGIVLDVLIRKHKTIRSSLGISVPVPGNTNQVIEAVFEGLLLREQTSHTQDLLPGMEEYIKPQKDLLFKDWDDATAKEKRSRTVFAQQSIKVDEVEHELKLAQAAIGSGVGVASFAKDALKALKAMVKEDMTGDVEIDLSECPRALRDAIGNSDKFKARFELPVDEDTIYLSRTHPIIEGLANYVAGTAIDDLATGIAARTGVIYTKQVKERTTVLLTRFRYHIIKREGDIETPLLAEECRLLAFAGSPASARWLEESLVKDLLQAKPDANIAVEQARSFLSRVIDDFDKLRPHLSEAAAAFGQQLLESHQRVRAATQAKGVSHRVEPKLPPDVLGIYVYLPVS